MKPITPKIFCKKTLLWVKLALNFPSVYLCAMYK